MEGWVGLSNPKLFAPWCSPSITSASNLLTVITRQRFWTSGGTRMRDLWVTNTLVGDFTTMPPNHPTSEAKNNMSVHRCEDVCYDTNKNSADLSVKSVYDAAKTSFSDFLAPLSLTWAWSRGRRVIGHVTGQWSDNSRRSDWPELGRLWSLMHFLCYRRLFDAQSPTPTCNLPHFSILSQSNRINGKGCCYCC